MTTTHLHGDCRDVLRTLPLRSAQVCVTSPPYWRLRKYTDDPREIGQEETPAAYVAALVDVFRAVWPVLRDDGVLFLNLGDAYANDGKWGGVTGGKHAGGLHGQEGPGRRKVSTGLPPKSLIGLPWRAAFALQDEGWVLRSEIIWHKPNAMPESVTDRPTRSHEYVFLFSKGPRYFFDSKAIAEEAKQPIGAAKLTGQVKRAVLQSVKSSTLGSNQGGELRNARSVWSIPTQPLADEHYAPMPQALAERCILAGSRPGDVVLDPFGGSGTTARAAEKLGRDAVLIELGDAYVEMQHRRTDGVQRAMTEVLYGE